MTHRLTFIPQGIILSAAMVVASRVGAEWAVDRGAFSPVAPVAGVALAGLFLWGLRMLPWVILAGVVSRFIQVSEWPPASVAILVAINTTSYVTAAAYLRAHSVSRELSTLADVRRFIEAGLILATISAMSPLILLVPEVLGGANTWWNTMAITSGVFFGRCAGAIIAGAVLLTFTLPDRKSVLTRSGALNFACLVGTTAITVLIFGPGDIERPITWLFFPPLILASLLGGSGLVSKMLLIIGVGAVWGTTEGFGPFSPEPANYSILQQFLCVASATALVLAATATEGRGKGIAEQRAEDLEFLSDTAVELLLSSDIAVSIQRCMAGLAKRCNVDLIVYHSGNGEHSATLRQVAEHGLENYANDEALLNNIESRVQEIALKAQSVSALGNAAELGTLRGKVLSLRAFECFPVLDGVAMRGVLSIGSRTRPTMDSSERKLLETVVFYIGSADRRLRQQAERKLLLESERAARMEAERVDRLKTEFLAMLSHELRNPLNAILGWTQLLLRGTIDVTKAAHIIEQSARLQAQLIEDLLDMSRIESGKLLLKKSVVELSNLLAGATGAMQPLAQEKGIELDAQLEPGIELVAADSIRLNQVVINLLSNAIKFTARGGRVTVSLAREGQEAVLTVSDTGEGISADFMPYVFVRFRQADQSTTRRSGGLGMGMAIAKHITELHGGTISVQSPGLGKGSTFVVRLPLTERAGAEATRLAQVREREGHRADAALMGRSIMVVEDDPATRDLLARVLCEKGAAVTTCERGAEALAKLRAHRPDLIISDIGMPDMDGYELMRQVRQEPHDTPHIPAIAVTAFARAEDKDAALRVGFDGHIPKPINLQHLEQLAADLISARAGGA